MTLAQRPWVAQAALATPLGPARIAATAQGLGGFWFDDQAHHPGPLRAPEDPSHPTLAQAAQELARYWDDAGAAHFEVPLDMGGTAFQRAVWRALLGIACGAHSSYAQIARAIGNPQAVRAVGAAVGRNPVSLIVPCHRVLGSDGSLTGYAGGLHRKRELLTREGLAHPRSAFGASPQGGAHCGPAEPGPRRRLVGAARRGGTT